MYVTPTGSSATSPTPIPWPGRNNDRAVFVDVAPVVCRTVEVRCDDTVDGEPARFDGVHYGEAGKPLVIGELLQQLRPVLAPFEGATT